MPGYEQKAKNTDSVELNQRSREDVAIEYLRQQKERQNDGMRNGKKQM